MIKYNKKLLFNALFPIIIQLSINRKKSTNKEKNVNCTVISLVSFQIFNNYNNNSLINCLHYTVTDYLLFKTGT